MPGRPAAAQHDSPVPPRGLTGEEADELAAALHDARRRQAAQLEEAAERAFDHIPRLLRAPVRRLMGA